MRLLNEFLTTLGFWALYAPLSLFTWYLTGSGFIFDLLVIFTIGLAFTVLGLVFWYFWGKRESAIYHSEAPPNQVPYVMPQHGPEELPLYFENVFKPDFGKIIQDLD